MLRGKGTILIFKGKVTMSQSEGTTYQGLKSG